MERASRNQTIFTSKPRGETLWIFLENRFVNFLKIVSMYWRTGLPKTPAMPKAALGVLLALAFQVQANFFQKLACDVIRQSTFVPLVFAFAKIAELFA
jgi:hypothetical protein